MKKPEYLKPSEKPKWMHELHGANTVLKKRKTQRNAPCPCGTTETRNGNKVPKKFKKCYLSN